MTDRLQCNNCDNMILPVTAQSNAGLCGVCRNRQLQEATQTGWDKPVICSNCQGESCVERVRGNSVSYHCRCCGFSSDG